MQASRQTLERLGVSSYIARLEVSIPEWHDLYHPHIHVIVDSPSGGRGYVSPLRLEDEWVKSLPDALHPLGERIHTSPLKGLKESVAYITKSPFHEYAKGREHEAVTRTLAAIRETSGVHKTCIRGRFRDDAHCAAA